MRLQLVAGALLMLALPAAMAVTDAQAADAIKGGRWEFTSQMQMAMPQMPKLPPGVSLPPGMALKPGGGMSVTHTACVDPDKAVPSDPRGECKIDRMQRDGSTVKWSTTCKTKEGTAHSEGEAHYSGDTMEATMTTEVPQANGKTMKTSQHITGHYLGPCAK